MHTWASGEQQSTPHTLSLSLSLSLSAPHLVHVVGLVKHGQAAGHNVGLGDFVQNLAVQHVLIAEHNHARARQQLARRVVGAEAASRRVRPQLLQRLHPAHRRALLALAEPTALPAPLGLQRPAPAIHVRPLRPAAPVHRLVYTQLRPRRQAHPQELLHAGVQGRAPRAGRGSQQVRMQPLELPQRRLHLGHSARQEEELAKGGIRQLVRHHQRQHAHRLASATWHFQQARVGGARAVQQPLQMHHIRVLLGIHVRVRPEDS